MKQALMPLLLLLAAACTARRSEPITGAVAFGDKSMERGRSVFMEHCNKCHPAGEAGLGPSLNDKARPKRFKRYAVRRGWGAMPAFSVKRISDKELEDLLAYLAALRHHHREQGADMVSDEIEARR